MDDKMKHCCPNCSQLYYILTLSPQLKGNIPRYLTCGHSMCENCIKNKVKFEEPMECKICHKNMEVEQNGLLQVNQNQFKINQVFPINKYMLGEIIGQVIENNEHNHPETDHSIDLGKNIKKIDNTKDVQQQSKPKTEKTKEITKPSTFGKEILKHHVKAGSMTSPYSFDSNHSSQPAVKPSYVSYDNPIEQQVVPLTESKPKELVEDVSYDNPAEQQVVPLTESKPKEMVEDVSYDNPAEQQVVPLTESKPKELVEDVSYDNPAEQQVMPLTESKPKELVEDVSYDNLAEQQVVPLTESKPKELVEGSQEIIYITHIVNPHHFFVQRACHQELVKKLLREFRDIGLLPQPSTKHVNEGKLYLAFNKAENRWQRCRVVSIDRSDINKPLYTVFSIDFGSTEIVGIDELRLLPPTREHSPFPLAINCALANCVPISGAWDSDDALLIQSIVDNKQAIIHVRKVVCMSNYSAKLNCDVFTYEDGASVAHTLVFHERADLQDARHIYAQIAGACEKPKLLVSDNDYKYRATYEVYLTHIASPGQFYVRKQCVQSVYEKLCEEMEQEYSIVVNSGTIYLPEIGCLYAVKAELRAGETGWCRGIVVQLLGRQRVRLQLCDTGNVVLVHYSALRKIHHKFTTLMALATECHLSGVSPLNKKWCQASVAFLNTFEGHVLELNVKNERNKNSIGVTLYEKSDLDNVICINKEMIKHKFAVSFGCLGLKILSNLRNEEAPKISKSKDLDAKGKGPLRLEAKVITDADTGPQTPECEESTSAVEKYTNKVLVSDRLPTEPAMHIYTNNDGVMYMLFCMLSYLYVISKQDTQDLIHKALEEPCNVLLDSKFSRGRILSVNKELLSRLTHYIYYGYEEQCAFADMRKNIALYEIRFNTNRAQKCILQRIKPAEGHWDRQTLDYIQKSIVKKQCLVKIKGPAVNGVIMIDLKFDKLLINAHLVEFEMATYIDGTKAAVPKFA